MKRATFLLTIIGLFPSSAFTQTQVVKIAAGEWPPFIGEELEGFGHIGKIITDVFSSQGYKVEFHFYPWKRAYKQAREGKYVATAVWMFSNERTRHFRYSSPVAQEEFVFFHRKDVPFEWQSLSDLQGMHLGGGLGYSYGADLDAQLNTGKITITRADNPSKALEWLKYRRVELVPEEKHIGLFTLQKMPIETQSLITFHPTPFLVNQSYVMFSKAHPEGKKLLKIFNQGLLQRNED